MGFASHPVLVLSVVKKFKHCHRKEMPYFSSQGTALHCRVKNYKRVKTFERFLYGKLCATSLGERCDVLNLQFVG